MTEIAHDPRTKQMIKDAIQEYLYEPVNRAHGKLLAEIIRKNCLLFSSDYESFTYRGKIYMKNPKDALPRRMLRLHPSLEREMGEYLSTVRKITDEEMPYVMGFVNQVLNSSNTFEDYLRVFPKSIHAPIIALRDICPCRIEKLTDYDIETLKEKNAKSLQLMKSRQVLNIII